MRMCIPSDGLFYLLFMLCALFNECIRNHQTSSGAEVKNTYVRLYFHIHIRPHGMVLN
jgi:hypothetical protein